MTIEQPRDPSTPAEWQEAVVIAEVMLLIDSARKYGLIAGGPDVDMERCLDVIDRGRALGYVASRAETDVAMHQILAELNAKVLPGFNAAAHLRTPEKSEG